MKYYNNIVGLKHSKAVVARSRIQHDSYRPHVTYPIDFRILYKLYAMYMSLIPYNIILTTYAYFLIQLILDRPGVDGKTRDQCGSPWSFSPCETITVFKLAKDESGR